jgi:hypothetical protein
MSFREVTMWTVVCDRCGKSADEDTDYVAWSDKDGAGVVAEGVDWLITHDNEHYCLDCVTWNSAEDELIPLPGRFQHE